MPRFSANVAFLFADVPFLERFSRAAAAGFRAVEFHFPYDHPAAEIRALVDRHGLAVTALNTAPGDVEAGEFGLAALRGREEHFDRQFDRALDYAVALDCPAIHVLSGVVPEDGREAALRTFSANLARVAPRASAVGKTILVEPLNTRDRPGYLFSTSDAVVAFLARLGQPNVKLMFDCYHVQIMEGDLITRLRRHWPRIGHVQVASVPDRAEPDTGEIAYPAIFAELDRLGYKGHVGAEYRPAGRTEDGLAWMAPWREE